MNRFEQILELNVDPLEALEKRLAEKEKELIATDPVLREIFYGSTAASGSFDVVYIKK